MAGVDVGNSTTEIVIADASVRPPRPVIWDRAPTRGVKGSDDAARGAAALLTRMERRSGNRVERVLMTPQAPVLTRRVDIPAPTVTGGAVVVLARGVATPSGVGHGVGRPFDIAAAAPSPAAAPVVLVARDPLGYRDTVRLLRAWQQDGHDVVALLLAGDEAALVASRVEGSFPIVDSVDPDEALSCALVAVEVAPAGQHVRALADPIWLVAALALEAADHDDARRASALTYGHRSAVIGRRQHVVAGPRATPSIEGVEFRDGLLVPFTQALAHLASRPVADTRGYTLPDQSQAVADDLWMVDLDALSELPGLRSGSVGDRRLIIAALSPPVSADGHAQAFAESWHGRVDVVASEAVAGRAGALTTPGIADDAWVIDLGGGTVDAIGPHGESITAAGCGDLMTSAVAHCLDVTRGAAEWVKRGPASRVESPFVLADESGDRRFVDDPAPHGTVGWLVTRGPSADLPFSRTLAPAEWRAMRLTLKRLVFADNLSRVLASVASSSIRDVVLIGGPAGDDEILEAINPALESAVVGRADVAAVLGHRWAVAYGLVRLVTPD